MASDDPVIDTTVAHAARTYDYLLGGVDHFPVDREAAERMYASAGGVAKARRRVRAQRDFLGRAVRYLAGEVGIRQFLDLGTGIPNADNVAAVARATAPGARVVGVDHDPVVLARAGALRYGGRAGAAHFVHADLRDHETVLRRAADTLDLSRPVAVVMVGVLHHFRDDQHPDAIVRGYVQAVAPGSYLVLTNIGRESDDGTRLGRVMESFSGADFTLVPRTRAELARFFDGLELVEPGVVFVDRWRPDGPPPDVETRHPCGVARKPSRPSSTRGTR